MSHYKSNLRDLEFVLFELLGREEVLGQGPFADVDADSARSILAQVDRMARRELAASFRDGDRTPPVFDPTTYTAPVPDSFRASYDAWMASGFWLLQVPPELGGTPAPASFIWAMGELVLGANAPVWMYGGGPFFAKIAFENGTARDQAIARHIIQREWGATMVLTEPGAGSDVGAGTTRATPNPDGTWNLEGIKHFITSGESDLQENIVHFVLARPEGVEGAGGPGTKGLSLFLVPKHHFDLETGELTGERNGVYATNVEHKMGIKVSNTCELAFGQPGVGGGEPARGHLLGEVHRGIVQMFQVIENARMFVGTKAIATLSTGYLNALEYSRTRVQGADLTRSTDKSAPRVTIVHHPDVRRSLMRQKSYAEAMRALVLYTASWQDAVAMAQHEGEADSERATLARAVNDLLLPVVKGYGSERSWVLLGTETLQTYGGSGFLQDHPVEQYVRDAKIDTLYEGTTAIQGMDLFFRKIVRDNGRAWGHLDKEIRHFAASNAGDGRLKEERRLLATALEGLDALLAHVVQDMMAAPEDMRSLYKVGLNTTRLLMAIGDVVCAWLLLRSAAIALEKLTTGTPEAPFYEGKVAAAQFFAATVLPGVTAELAVAQAVGLSLMELAEEAF